MPTISELSICSLMCALSCRDCFIWRFYGSIFSAMEHVPHTKPRNCAAFYTKLAKSSLIQLVISSKARLDVSFFFTILSMQELQQQTHPETMAPPSGTLLHQGPPASVTRLPTSLNIAPEMFVTFCFFVNSKHELHFDVCLCLVSFATVEYELNVKGTCLHKYILPSSFSRAFRYQLSLVICYSSFSFYSTPGGFFNT